MKPSHQMHEHSKKSFLFTNSKTNFILFITSATDPFDAESIVYLFIYFGMCERPIK